MTDSIEKVALAMHNALKKNIEETSADGSSLCNWDECEPCVRSCYIRQAQAAIDTVLAELMNEQFMSILAYELNCYPSLCANDVAKELSAAIAQIKGE